MGKIKSALELAMEKTVDITIDKEAFHRDSMKKEGRVTASRYLKKELSDLKTEIKARKNEDKRPFSEGIVETLLANLVLPQKEDDLSILPILEKGLMETGVEKHRVQEIFRQISQLFQQYFQSMDQLSQMLKKQYEPQLRAKEQKLRQQTGQDIKIEAERDPDFNRLLAERLSALDEQYRQVLSQAREELKKSL